jgi:CheY-like chemotaxis protein
MPHLAGRTVLVVDDDVRNLLAVTSLLENKGMRVVPAASGQEAIDVLGREPSIDLVLMDVMMPRWTAIRRPGRSGATSASSGCRSSR